MGKWVLFTVDQAISLPLKLRLPLSLLAEDQFQRDFIKTKFGADLIHQVATV